MAKRIAQASGSKAKAAKGWISRGISVIPIVPGGKRPRGKWDGAHARGVRPNEVEQVFSTDGIGGLWGKPSNGVIDIDLDTREAVRVAKKVLPSTFRYGRPSNSASHYLYKCVGAKASTKWSNPDTRGVILELRSTGTQSLLPPTMHPDGEAFRIEQDVEFTSVEFGQLKRHLGKIAAVALAAQYYPAESGRHDFVHAWTGALLHSGFSGTEATELGELLLDAVSPKEDDRRQRERTIKNTVELHKSSKTQGWKTLEEIGIPKACIEKIKLWLKAKGGEVEAGDIVVGKRTEDYEPIPSDLLDPNLQAFGVIRELMEWVRENSYVRQPLFELATALMIVAMCSKNRYVVGQWHTPLQPYFMLLANTSSGKENALRAVGKFANARAMSEWVMSGFQSAHALSDKMTNPPHACVWLFDEAARKMQSASRSNGPDAQVMTALVQAYGQANGFVGEIAGRHHTIPAMEHPFLLVLAATQPRALIEAASGQDLSTGVLNRFMLFDAPNAVASENIRLKDVGGVGREWMSRVRENAEGRFYEIPMGTDAYRMSRDFFKACIARSQSDDMYGQFWGRANQQALVLAGLRAIARDPQRPKITAELFDWSQRFVTWSTQRWLARLGGKIASSHNERLYLRIKDFICNPERYAHRAQSKKQAELAKGGIMPHSLLMSVASVTKRELEPIVEALEEAELVTVAEHDGAVVYARRDRS